MAADAPRGVREEREASGGRPVRPDGPPGQGTASPHAAAIDARATQFATASAGARRGPLSAAAITRVAAVAVVLAAWELGYRAGTIDPFFFSSPSLIWSVLVEQFGSGRIWPHLWVTVQEALAGLAIGFLAGAALGWLAAMQRRVADVVEPFMLLLNSVPRVVVAPLFIMWFGIGLGSKIALALFLVFVVIFFAVYSGLKEVDRALVERVVVLGGSRRDLLREVYVPSVLAWVFSSLRVTVGFAFTGAVVGEFIASSRGLGYLLNFAQNSYNASLMMATVGLIMAIIVAVFAVLSRIEQRATMWKQR
jgi:NitT/TauT family transport system permease protein